MSKKPYAFYFAEYRDIHDLANGNKRKLSPTTMQRLLLHHGVVTGIESDGVPEHARIASLLAEQQYTFGEIASITEIFANMNLDPSYSSMTLLGLARPKLAAIIGAARNQYLALFSEDDVHIDLDDHKVPRQVRITFKEVDLSKARLIQTRWTSASLLIRFEGRKCHVRVQRHERAEIFETLLQELAEKASGKPTEFMRLPSGSTAKTIVTFLEQLRNGGAFTNAQVASVAATLPDAPKDQPHLEELRLKGNALEQVQEMIKLVKDGYVIHKLQWTADIGTIGTDARSVDLGVTLSGTKAGIRICFHSNSYRKFAKNGALVQKRITLSALDQQFYVGHLETRCRDVLDALDALAPSEADGNEEEEP